jgi:putative transposase
MQARWGRKVSDLGFGSFLSILEWVALKRGKQGVKIGRFEPTTGKCSVCGHRQKLELREPTFHCDACGLTLDRDWNAAINILCGGASTPYQSERKPRLRSVLRTELRSRVDGSSPSL